MTEPCKYKVYSRKYDRTIDAAKLDSVLGPVPLKFRSDYNELCSVFEQGLAAWRARLNVYCAEAAKRIADILPEKDRQDTAVTLLVDHSGSMRGQRILYAAAATMCLTDWLGSLGMKVEVLGFTTVSWRGGRPRRWWNLFGARNPGRLCELLHIVYRKSTETTPGMPWSVRAMLRADLPKENVDGEALEWAASRLRSIDATKKILIVLSDGGPVDDSTLAANHGDYLADHLKSVVQEIGRSGDVKLGAVDICSGYSAKLYPRFTKADVVDELGQKAVNLIEEMLLETQPVS